jgi:hypothetical protein
MASGGGTLRGAESDALMESTFRRLVGAIDSERERIRGTWQQLQQDRDGVTAELERLRQDTEDWCGSEKQKIEMEWKRLDKLSEKMNDIWPQATEVIEINCSGQVFTLPKTTLCSIEGSVLTQMFSDEFIEEIPRDEAGRFYLDFNPQCFSLLVEYLQNRRLRADAPLPVIPMAQQQNMDLLAEAWQLKPFLHENRLNPLHGTSLHVSGNVCKATHPGWQVISAEHPLPIAGPSYFEVKVLCNPDVKGGMAIGLCGHIPQGAEVHTLRQTGSVLYNSNNGLIGDGIDSDDIAKGIQFVEGTLIGVQHDPTARSLAWFHNQKFVGSCTLKIDMAEKMQALYPLFALYVPDQAIQVEFHKPCPTAGS